MLTTLTVADVKCYHCGHVSGEMIAKEGQPLAHGTFRPTSKLATTIQPNTRLRCARCGGPVYLDDVRSVRPAPPLALADLHPRRGRPRRSEILARAS